MADTALDALTPSQRVIYEAVRDNPGCSLHDIADALYGDRADGGPEDAEGTVYTQIRRMRRRLRPFGLWIAASQQGRGATWRIEPL